MFKRKATQRRGHENGYSSPDGLRWKRIYCRSAPQQRQLPVPRKRSTQGLLWLSWIKRYAFFFTNKYNGSIESKI